MDQQRMPSRGDGEDGTPVNDGAAPGEPTGEAPEEPTGEAAGERAGWRSGRWWGKPLAVSVTALAAMAVLTLATIAQSPDAKAGSGAPPATDTSPAPSPAPTTPSPAPTTAPTTAAPPASATTAAPADDTTDDKAAAGTASTPAALSAAAAAAAAKKVRAAVGALPGAGDLAVAVVDLDGTGAGTAYDTSDDADNTYDTASIVKVDILAALLLQAQHAGTHLSTYQRTLATAMIERSDNDAATALWDTIGRAYGLDAANRTLGLRGTEGGRGELWGLTQTTAGDQLTLLRAVFGDAGGSPLSAASRVYLTGLMGSVTAGQRWGVSAADSDDEGYALKNGWLQRTATGLWDINSIGEVGYEGHRLLIAVLASGQASESGGIDLVEDAALAVAKAYTG
jgi:hypothetical protein